MNLPNGEVRERSIVSDLGETLEAVLEKSLTGYIQIESDTSILATEDATLLLLERGVPRAAIDATGDTQGATALAEAAVADLYRIERHALSPEQFDTLRLQSEEPAAIIKPGLPAAQLAGDNDLARRTREAAPGLHPGLDDDSHQLDAVESFLDDTEAIASIRDRARSEARERADEWGFAVESDDQGPLPEVQSSLDEE